MTQLESDKVLINRNAQAVFDYLINFNNYEKLMPEQVIDWQSNELEGSFTIKNMATIGLKIGEKISPTSVTLDKTKAPFDLTLHCVIENVSESSCNLKINLDADLNSFLKMVAQKPLTNFINILVQNCKKVCE